MQRFLKLLATVDDPAEVLAITFTRKATAELRNRILKELENTAAATRTESAFEQATRTLALAVLARDRQRDWQLLDNPNRLNIRTIDSLAGEIAATHLSANPANPTEDAAPLYTEAARRTLQQLGGSHPTLPAAIQELLLHRDNNLANCEALLAEMLSLRDQWRTLVPAQLDDAYLDAHILPQLDRALDLVICRGLTALTQRLPPGFLDDLSTLAANMAHAEGYQGRPSPIALCASITEPPRETTDHLDRWLALIDLLLVSSGAFRSADGLKKNHLNFEISKKHKQQLSDIIDSIRADDDLRALLCATRDLPPARYPAQDWPVAKSFFRVLAHALAELQQAFAENASCDFTEINLRAADALRSEDSSGDLPLGARLQHLLVDEMQDTSAGQYQLIELLTQHWDGASQTLFLVGDPRQSIYLFRQARVERFLHIMRSATLGAGPDAIPLHTIRLTANFRSQQRLVASFNRDFARIFPSQPTPTEPDLISYTPALAVRPPTPTAAFTWHAHTLPTVKDQQTKVHRRQLAEDAEEIRRIIQHWQAAPRPPSRTEPWRIAVLVAARTHLLQIVRTLREHGIPYRAVNVEPLRERQEILDLLALTRALLHPADRTAWLSLLRTPWCGLTLADLHLLAGADDASFTHSTVLEAIAQRANLLSADGQSRLAAFHAVIAAALAQRGRLPISQWISRTWQAFAAPAFTDPASLLNVERYFALLDDLTASAGTLDLANLARRLELLYAAPSLAPNAVDLMTIHTAKGLEWDVVLIPALERPGRTPTNRLLSWLEVDPDPAQSQPIAPGIVAPIFAKGAEKGRLQQWIWNVQSAREAAERKRLFYVACTRAREELHLFASSRVKSAGTLEVHSASLLAAAWPAAEPRFAVTPAIILQMPAAATTETLALAAAAEQPQPQPQTRTIQRIPLAAFTLPSAEITRTAPPSFKRPEGSIAARATGNTLHTLLDLLAQLHAAGESVAALQQQITQWRPRIAALLRAAGLSPAEVDRLIPAILRGLTQTLADPHGQWLLAPHPRAASEPAFTSAGGLRSIRLDRIFLAGPTPLAPGATHLWIVDFKTTAHSRRGLEAFLQTERETYSPQLHTYAARLTPLGYPIRLALYYPLLPTLTWWDH